jgi:AraC family transcriptional regulator
MMKGESIMDMKLEKKPAFTVVGMKYRGKNAHDEIPALWGQFMPRVPEIKDVANRQFCYGAEDNCDEVGGEFSYMACVEVSQTESIPEGMETWQIPANTYAVFPCTLPTIRDTFANMPTELVGAGLEQLPDPLFELYDETFDPQDPNSPMYIYVPVQKK